MFVLQSEPVFAWPVTVHSPGDDGTWQEGRFQARFRLLDRAAIEAATTAEATDALMRDAVVELVGLVDERNVPIPHSADVLDACLRNPWIRGGLVRAYMTALAGKPSAAALGN